MSLHAHQQTGPGPARRRGSREEKVAEVAGRVGGVGGVGVGGGC